MKRRKSGPERAPAPLTTLTGDQERTLREAAAKPGGVYVGLCGKPGADELVAGGAAEWRLEHVVGKATVSSTSDRLCEYDEYYLVPTAHGLALLQKIPNAAVPQPPAVRSK